MEETVRYEKVLLPFKVQQLLDAIIIERGLGIEDALEYLYSSELYRQLSEGTYLWRLSASNLYDMLKQEKNEAKQAQDNSSQVLLFISFCIENYKEHHQIEANEVLFLFKKYGVIKYLTLGFDVLHTQGKDYIMADIDNYLDNRR
ncbi:MAG: DUF3791 domain-containing protein [Mangrovibacterium sp.]